eukprot:6203049-Pleurochrysis_carterae.AAC.4
MNSEKVYTLAKLAPLAWTRSPAPRSPPTRERRRTRSAEGAGTRCLARPASPPASRPRPA